MNRLDWLKDRHKGGRCVLIANGPSLNGMDLSFLNKQITIGLNKIYLGLNRFNFYPKYYVAINPTVIQQSISEIKKLNCVKFLGNNGAQELIKEDALTYLVNTQNPPARFCKNLSVGLHEGWTVTYAALQVAYYLGFYEVIIIGMDHHFIYSGKPNEAHVLEGADPNHFSDNYFGYSQQWDNPDLEKSEESYRMAKKAYEEEGRLILDATVDGKCNIFKKIDYQSYFGLK
ncbi:6-hydroxymethylpterin diphosphokinase MptE-like protein [Legionella longbeachae]|uniref:6-hydroxymethylpterin diphosphokinase MptE-like protein n=1 Tax=Legionella longbeachae TaxID=450 RepID=UPI00124842C5|nr:6-hydroxymethylpterin diphosphokinase MptE-like protein [Legionella longbeachae]QEY52874.1 DUF115 domain-containing protein [Legionella longbeachae]